MRESAAARGSVAAAWRAHVRPCAARGASAGLLCLLGLGEEPPSLARPAAPFGPPFAQTPVAGLYLLYLLSQNRVAEFHTELVRAAAAGAAGRQGSGSGRAVHPWQQGASPAAAAEAAGATPNPARTLLHTLGARPLAPARSQPPALPPAPRTPSRP